MKYFTIVIFLVLFLIHIKVSHCSTNKTEILQKKNDAEVVENVVRKFKTMWTWIKQQAGAEDTFVGRCAGALKKFGMAINFIIFKLGVIVTALAFLSVLAFKSLGLGVLILIISSIGLTTKLFALKGAGGGHESSPNGAVHLHLYNKGGEGGGHHYDHHDQHSSSWYDRLDHVVPKNQLERMAIADLYKRLKISESLYGTTSGGGTGTFS